MAIITITHQGSTFSLYLFTFVLSIITQHIQEPMTQYMIFADDISLLGIQEKE